MCALPWQQRFENLPGIKVIIPFHVRLFACAMRIYAFPLCAQIVDRSIATLLHRGGCAISERNILCLGSQKVIFA